MKDKVLMHAGSLLGGVIHNLNTPLMWIMGRSQLIQARNEGLEMKDLSDEEFRTFRDKNDKDLNSISEGAERIDRILKGLSYKIQMSNEGYTSIELKEYLAMEINFLMADMKFKHETKIEELYNDAPSNYVKTDYNALSWTLIQVVETMIENTGKGRCLKFSLDNGMIRLNCPELQVTGEVREKLKTVAEIPGDSADMMVVDTDGLTVTISIRE